MYTEIRPGTCPPPLPEEGSAFWVIPEGPGEGNWEQVVAAAKLVHSWRPASTGAEGWVNWPSGAICSRARVRIQPQAPSPQGTRPFPGHKCDCSHGCSEDEEISGVCRQGVLLILWQFFDSWVSSLHQILVRL